MSATLNLVDPSTVSVFSKLASDQITIFINDSLSEVEEKEAPHFSPEQKNIIQEIQKRAVGFLEHVPALLNPISTDSETDDVVNHLGREQVQCLADRELEIKESEDFAKITVTVFVVLTIVSVCFAVFELAFALGLIFFLIAANFVSNLSNENEIFDQTLQQYVWKEVQSLQYTYKRGPLPLLKDNEIRSLNVSFRSEVQKRLQNANDLKTTCWVQSFIGFYKEPQCAYNKVIADGFKDLCEEIAGEINASVDNPEREFNNLYKVRTGIATTGATTFEPAILPLLDAEQFKAHIHAKADRWEEQMVEKIVAQIKREAVDLEAENKQAALAHLLLKSRTNHLK